MVVRMSHCLLAGALALLAATATAWGQTAAPPVPTPAETGTTAEPEVLLPPVNAAIRDILEMKSRHGSFLNKRDAAGLVAFYSVRGYAPAWIVDGKLSERARALIGRIAKADEDGLDPRHYALPPLDTKRDIIIARLIQAERDVLVSRAIVAYAREAYAGRVDPSTLGNHIGYERHLPDPMQILTAVILADDPVAMLASYNPSHPGFIALRKKLAELRTAAANAKPAPPPLPDGPNLKLGIIDPRVPLLRARFELPTDVDAPDIYDEAVAEAVKKFQEARGLKADGIFGPASLAALNEGPRDPIPVVLANMERWRWMPRDLGDFHVRVNIPDYTVSVMRDGKATHTTRVIVGKPSQQTPIFSDQIEHIVVNPSWNVPASIARNEMLPAARANPGSLRGYQVLANIHGRYRVIDPWMVNWNRVDMSRIRFRQPPGEDNALGKIKFLFPNHYAVYLHDTPAKNLFQRDVRAFSHGCVRVMDPMAFADALLAEEPELDAARLERMVGGDEKWVNLTKPVPVHLTYFTAWVDEAGELQMRPDVYGHDEKLVEALGLVERTT